MTFNAQELNQRILVQEFTFTQDPITGAAIESWDDKFEVFAKAEGMVGQERFVANQTLFQDPVKFTVRYRDDIKAGDRVVWRGKNYDVQSIVDIKGKRRELLLYTEGGISQN